MNRLIQWIALWGVLSLAHAQAQSINQDYWSPLVKWQQASGIEVTPIHVGLLPTGDLFFIESYDLVLHPQVSIAAPGFLPEYMFVMTPTPAYTPTPDSVFVSPVAMPFVLQPQIDTQAQVLHSKSLTCSGHSLMADGTLFFASGNDSAIDLSLYNSGNVYQSLTVNGVAESFTFSPFTKSWRQNPSTIVPGPVTGRPLRWYATVTRLADARMLVTGGYEKVVPTLAYNPSVEIFDPVANAWSKVSATSETPPGLENPDYTHVFQFPYGYTGSAGTPVEMVTMLGGSGEPLLLFIDGQNKSWLRTQNYRPGATAYLNSSAPLKVFPNYASSSALLPLRLPESSWGYLNGSVINVGGPEQTAMAHSIDVYDPIANAWRASVAMSGPRQHPATILLPDGRILIIAGHNDVNASNVGYAEYVDPKNNFAVTRGAAYMPEVRGYHSVAVLLPDGRVLVGSGNIGGVDGVERSDFRYYYPDYMFKTRPQIASASDTMNIADYSIIAVPHGTQIGEAALVGLGAMTHSFDMGQRHVQLRVLDPHYTIGLIAGQWMQATADQCVQNTCYDLQVLQAPLSKELAPPGYYMLFVLDSNRVPSPGKIVKLQ